VCAAEALSFVTRQSDDAVAKRLRLTLGNGHGLAALIDQTHQHEEIASSDKRLLRAQWWKKVMMLPSRSAELGDSALYDHPAILAAVKEIELVSQQGEKVLVFGRFTRPLRALVKLLNAREMLRCLDTNQLWPQSKVAEDKDDHLISEWVAVQAAHRQLARPSKLLRDDLDRQLGEQYGEFEKQRINNREHLLEKIAEGISKGNHNHRIQTLFEALKMNVNDGHSLAVVTRAVTELIGPDIDSATPKDFATAFANIVDAACDRDESDSDGNGELDADEAEELLPNLITRLHAEYSRPEGGFARLMNGNTKPATRRLLQLAFNRTHSHPKVLVAQSVVGREGLNLHEACRTVVLLHPEWNPGVVEQQIGRVDRIGSLWQSKLEEAIEKKIVAADVPRIEIRPVIFQGTYDEKNWKILRNRWDDLRAQLHGIVISSRIAESYQNAELLIEEINKEAPNFSPS
jgi:hypothetical protein